MTDGFTKPLFETPWDKSDMVPSPDGVFLAYPERVDQNRLLKLLSPGGGTVRELAAFQGGSIYPIVWSPDGQWIAYEGEVDGKDGVFKKRADGTGDAQVLVAPGTLTFPAPTSWSPDGRAIMVQPDGGGGRSDLWVVAADGKGKPEPVLNSPYDESAGAIAPDGRWLAYTSDETGRREVFVMSFPPGAGGGKWQRGARPHRGSHPT